jgi:hypothetical protein
VVFWGTDKVLYFIFFFPASRLSKKCRLRRREACRWVFLALDSAPRRRLFRDQDERWMKISTLYFPLWFLFLYHKVELTMRAFNAAPPKPFVFLFFSPFFVFFCYFCSPSCAEGRIGWSAIGEAIKGPKKGLLNIAFFPRSGAGWGFGAFF